MKAHSCLKRTLSLMIVLCLTWGLPPSIDNKAMALSIQDEREVGQAFFMQISSRYDLVSEPFAAKYINDLGQFLIQPLETKPFPFHFYIINDSTLNAFAGPGGYIFFYAGLIEAMDRVDELAAVMCHEIGHIAARHLSKRIDQTKNIGIGTIAGILAGILTGGPLAAAMITGSMAAGMQAQYHYSREDERQADQLSHKYLKPSTFDSKAMISALQKIQKGSWNGTGKIPPYLLTHPTGPERMSNLESLSSTDTEQAPCKEALYFRALFPVFQTVVIAVCKEPNEAKRHFQDALLKNPQDWMPQLGLGIVYMRESKYKDAIAVLKKARAKQPEFVTILRTLGEAYMMDGQNKRAVCVLEDAFDQDRGDTATLFLMGTLYEEEGKNDKALRIFKKLSYLKPVRREVYYHLGICYGREKQLAEAHYNFGIFFKSTGRFQKAMFHFKKAESLASGNVVLKEKIRKETKQMEEMKEHT